MIRKGLSGADFDKTYVTQQIQAHKDAQALIQTYAKTGDTPAIKALERESVPSRSCRR